MNRASITNIHPCEVIPAQKLIRPAQSSSSPISAAQVSAFAVQAMEVSVFASAMGMMLTAMGTTGLTTSPINLEVNQPAIAAMRKTFGDAILMKALDDFPVDDNYFPTIPELATRIEVHVKNAMIKKYGREIAVNAMKEANPGDLEEMIEIAKMMANKTWKGRAVYNPMEELTRPSFSASAVGLTSLGWEKKSIQGGSTITSKSIIGAGTGAGVGAGAGLQKQTGTGAASSTAQQVVKKKSSLAGRKKAKPVLDTQTGKIYKSLGAAGTALASEYNVSLTRTNSEGQLVPNTFAYYEIVKKAPNRFKVLV